MCHAVSQITEVLRARRLLLDEIAAAAGLPLEETKKILAALVKEKQVKSEAGLRWTNRQAACVRCGNEALFGEVADCGRCGKTCVYCRGCLMMGRVMSCSRLYSLSSPGHAPAKEAAVLAWEGELSPKQQAAADKLTDTYRGGKEKELLLWAVCGAGKTEMLFPLIQAALKDGNPVMIATPRRDVVQELEPRLRQAFPKAVTAGLYGGKPVEERYGHADITVATTHQLLRFHDAFPVMIIDEVDAFPYTVDEKLKYAVQQAKKKEALTVLVTATPSSAQQKLVHQKKLAAAVVARRYHGFDLPVPGYAWAGFWKKKLEQKQLPAQLRIFLQKHEKQQVLLFVPEVRQLEKVQQALERIFERRIATVHAGEEDRTERVQAFRRKDIDILITTTILERGITIENVQVAVLGAEAPIFTTTALIQIAGRAGRSSRYPSGDVVFFHYGKTAEMIQAVQTIRMLNRERS